MIGKYKNLNQAEVQTTQKLKDLQDSVLEILKEKVEYHQVNNSTSIHGLHALIGSKNNTFVDSVKMQFRDPDDFIARWLKGLIDSTGHQVHTDKNGRTHKYILIELLKNDTFRDYSFTFLERNFYRNYNARTRYKPKEQLWIIWFGDNNLKWGLAITPTLRNSEWTNDVNEIRRANFKYWTIGHILTSGIIDPDSNKLVYFDNLQNLIMFYRSILKRISNSIYEKEIFDRYIDYLKKNENVYEEPFLIPELRYAGLEHDHKYRLDFTIFNIHTNDFIGFEFSPHSTHMAINGITKKTQVQLNSDLSLKWGKEMDKRNEYFKNFGITTITFTDSDLKNMDKCFKEIETFLSARFLESTDLAQQIQILNSL
ncbi:hypothetical protein BED47_07700 [Gottfriedia luciferensis]|uniref:Topoisomerase II n=1 Tax=Gottfriedia luciferensis TaxID=178774 RepID=A0ABX2ZSN3_9BACI|nr:hypothetical protein [Gottfriedia luciferensis]ODG91527.1 hypothetical protein BED47_07700 [Gottfriedia luciferensis]